MSMFGEQNAKQRHDMTLHLKKHKETQQHNTQHNIHCAPYNDSLPLSRAHGEQNKSHQTVTN